MAKMEMTESSEPPAKIARTLEPLQQAESHRPLIESALMLASLTANTGNAITAARIASVLPARRVSSFDVSAVGSQTELAAKLSECSASFAIGVHAYRSGKLLLDCGMPYCIVLGGTDMNEHIHDESKGEIIRKVVKQAAAIVAFDYALLSTLVSAVPSAHPKSFVIPQAVEVCKSTELMPSSEIRRQLGAENSDILLLLPAGLRPVKDVLYVIDAICALHKRDPRIVLRIVGPILDTEYAQAVDSTLLSCAPIVTYCGALPRDELHAAIAAADAVLNTSISEGMCNSLLEAMLLGTPVLARSNSGNSALIEDGVTGLLFHSPDDLVRKTELLLCEDGRSFAKRLTAAALTKVEAAHSIDAERAQYKAVVEHVLANRAA